jgi:thymidylate synthase ThyX
MPNREPVPASPAPPAAPPEPTEAPPSSSADVYAIHGVEPEVQAYAMAKYSRSALSMKESLREISEQKAEKFLNTFYFQYGHRSIADLAHLAFALERLSLLAAIAVVDEPRWDGQERSTRYQDFSHPRYYVPGLGGSSELRQQFEAGIESLFAEYRQVSQDSYASLCARIPRPAEMSAEQYERTLQARAFDIARYCLPLATTTSLGQIVNARTLESQISRLLCSPFEEVREIGAKLKQAARDAAYDPESSRKQELYQELQRYDAPAAQRFSGLLLKEVHPAPTLVKYAEPSRYAVETRTELTSTAAELMAGIAIDSSPGVDLLDDEPVEIELATTLLYEHCHHSYRQIREQVEALSAARRQGLIELGSKHRGPHDELLRACCSGQRFRFDILMDVGGFRDLHRHRRCIQIGQEFSFAHSFDTPDDIASSCFAGRYAAAMTRAAAAADEIAAQLASRGHGAQSKDALYLMPLAYRKRTLFKMDFAEAVYISELRTAPAGHFSYRHIAWQMYEAVGRRHPALAGYFRVHDPREPSDLLQR